MISDLEGRDDGQIYFMALMFLLSVVLFGPAINNPCVYLPLWKLKTDVKSQGLTCRSCMCETLQKHAEN